MQLENTRNLSKVLQIYFSQWHLRLIRSVQAEIFGEEALFEAVNGSCESYGQTDNERIWWPQYL